MCYNLSALICSFGDFMIILGIDPGLATVGWGIIENNRGALRPVAYGAITTPAHTNAEDRIKVIYDELDTIIKIRG